MTVKWLSDDCPMTVRWLSNDCPMTVRCPIWKQFIDSGWYLLEPIVVVTLANFGYWRSRFSFSPLTRKTSAAAACISPMTVRWLSDDCPMTVRTLTYFRLKCVIIIPSKSEFPWKLCYCGYLQIISLQFKLWLLILLWLSAVHQFMV